MAFHNLMNDVLNRGGNLGEPEEQAGRYKQKSLAVMYLRNLEPEEGRRLGKRQRHLTTSG